MFSLFIVPKRRTFGHFLASLEDKLFFAEKEDMSSKRKTYGKPTVHPVMGTINLSVLKR